MQFRDDGRHTPNTIDGRTDLNGATHSLCLVVKSKRVLGANKNNFLTHCTCTHNQKRRRRCGREGHQRARLQEGDIDDPSQHNEDAVEPPHAAEQPVVRQEMVEASGGFRNLGSFHGVLAASHVQDEN